MFEIMRNFRFKCMHFNNKAPVLATCSMRGSWVGMTVCWLVLVSTSFCQTSVALAKNVAAQDSVVVTLRGTMTQGGLIIGQAPPASQVKLNDRQIKVSPQGDFVFGFGRDAALEHQLRVETARGTVWQKGLVLEPREYDIQKITGIKKRIMNPKAADLQRIRQDSAEVKAARQRLDDRLDFLEKFEWPVQGRISGVYGSQRVYNGVPKRPHFGLDIAAPMGTVVKSPAPGVVTLAHPDMFYSGGTLIIDHGFGVSSTFLHLSKILVKVGERIETGDLIAEVGASGRSTGPHLDWRMNWLDQRVDVELLLDDAPRHDSTE